METTVGMCACDSHKPFSRLSLGKNYSTSDNIKQKYLSWTAHSYKKPQNKTPKLLKMDFLLSTGSNHLNSSRAQPQMDLRSVQRYLSQHKTSSWRVVLVAGLGKSQLRAVITNVIYDKTDNSFLLHCLLSAHRQCNVSTHTLYHESNVPQKTQ